MSEIEVRELIKDEYKVWDELVEKSPQGTIFHNSSWLTIHSELLNKKLKIYGCFENDQLVGGCSLYIYKLIRFFKMASSAIGMTPYGGVVLAQLQSTKVREQEQTYNKIIKSLRSVFDNEHFGYIQLRNSPDFVDIRPFTWNGWDSKVYYAYYLILNDFEKRLSRDPKRNIKKAIKNEIRIEKSKDITSFYDLFEETFSRQGLKPPVTKGFVANIFDMLLKHKKGEMLIAKTKSEEIAAAEIFVYDNKRAYRWSAATHSELRKTGAYSLLLFDVFKDMQNRGFKEINLTAANSQQLAEFITGFNPKLVPYYVVEKSSNKYKIVEIASSTIKNVIYDKSLIRKTRQ
jgi:hypothetical protein